MPCFNNFKKNKNQPTATLIFTCSGYLEWVNYKVKKVYRYYVANFEIIHSEKYYIKMKLKIIISYKYFIICNMYL